MLVVGALLPQARGTPTGIHIGSTPRIRKGFVIALANRRSPVGHENWVFLTTATRRFVLSRPGPILKPRVLGIFARCPRRGHATDRANGRAGRPRPARRPPRPGPGSPRLSDIRRNEALYCSSWRVI